MPTKRFKEQVRDWRVLHDNLAPRLPDLPLVADDHAALAQVLAKVDDLENQQELARSALRDLNEQRKVTKKEGQAVQRRLALKLKGALGEQNEKLLGFAIKPRQREFPRQHLSAAQKAARAAARAAAKAAAAKAAEKEAELPTSTPPPVPSTP